MTKLDLAEFRRFNLARSQAPKDRGGFNHSLDSWSPLEWGGALSGEVGEFCNLLKKIRRGEIVKIDAVADEAGDVLAYLDLACASCNIDLAQAAVVKWDAVSIKRKYAALLGHRIYR